MIDTIQPYFELIYFIAGGPVLAVMAFWALKQITVLKHNAKIASIREAYRISAEQVNVYLTHIVPALNELDKQIKANGLTFLDNPDITVGADSIAVNVPLRDDDIAKIINIASPLLNVLNRLETFSLYFTSQVAAEEVAYTSIGGSFVFSLKRLLPALIPLAQDKHFESTLKLFHIWFHRLEAEKLKDQEADIQQKLKTHKTIKISPIGTSD